MNGVDALERFGAVDLVQLNAEAELQTRVDRKYIIPADALADVLCGLPDGTLVLDIDGDRALRYESRYFDTPSLDSYLGAAYGRRHRFKVRGRRYVDSDASFLEVKTRGGRSTTVKDRVPLALTRRGLDEEALAYTTETLSAAGIADAESVAERLRPTLITRYRRATLLLPAADGRDALRGTIDIDLAWSESGGGETLRLPRSVIVETKSGRSAGALDRALWRSGHRPATLSKYGTGLAALRSQLPSNKWRRVLTQHFADARLSAPLAERAA